MSFPHVFGGNPLIWKDGENIKWKSYLLLCHWLLQF